MLTAPRTCNTIFKRFLLLLFAISSSKACVPCDCAVPHTIVCRHLTEFPRFSERERRETTLLDITESSLKNIPEFTRVDWPALDLVTLWNNSNDLCKYSGWHDDILFENYDCSPSPPTIEVCLAAEPQEHPQLHSWSSHARMDASNVTSRHSDLYRSSVANIPAS